jgi:hypothetical protein
MAVMKMKMPSIQFVSIVNLIQMKSMKVIYKTKSTMNKEFQHFVELTFTSVSAGAGHPQTHPLTAYRGPLSLT